MITIAALLLRSIGFVSFLPFRSYARGVVPRGIIASGLTLLCYPFVPEIGLSAAQSFTVMSLVGEFLIGMLVALPVALSLSLASIFGELFDAARGQSIAESYSPLTGAGASLTGNFLHHAAFVALVLSGGIESMFLLFRRSIQYLPPISSDTGTLSSFSHGVLEIVFTGLTLAFQIFLPLAFMFLIVDFAFGLISRGLPGLPVFMKAFQVKTFIGSIALYLLCRIHADAHLFASFTAMAAEVLRAGA